jgi:ribonucleoside-diphosphate reductase alpha chain
MTFDDTNLIRTFDNSSNYASTTCLTPSATANKASIAAIKLDYSRDNLLTSFGKSTLKERYLLPDEDYQGIFARVAVSYADDQAHAQRMYDYISKLWFMPATPVLSNAGTTRGNPISCFLNEASDSLTGIVDMWTENVWLGARGGGIGTYFGNLRSVNEKIGKVGKTSGIIPFIRVMDSITMAIAQGSLRRGAAAVYLGVDHPEIMEFINIRRPTGGDPNRKAQYLHHGVLIKDAFMEAVKADAMWDFKSPATNEVISQIKARELWIAIMIARVETGEPYIIFSDTVARQQPEIHKKHGLKIKASNLCSEILLPTGPDHKGKDRTAVCCLSSVNLATWHEWKNEPSFIEDAMRFLDNVLQSFIDNAEENFVKAKYAAMRERSVGLGVMGFHSFLQQENVPFEGVMAQVWNKKMFQHIRKQADAASYKLATQRGACPDAADLGIHERFVHKIAIAPTASISIIAGNSSPGIEPWVANTFTQKTLDGSFLVSNKALATVLESYGKNDDLTWESIKMRLGSVQHLAFLTDHQKDVFKTAQELDQRWIIQHAADRTPYICQSQSVNVFLAANMHKRDLHKLHMMAWELGLKSLYYCRSLSLSRADTVSETLVKGDYVMHLEKPDALITEKPSKIPLNYGEECLSCQ